MKLEHYFRLITMSIFQGQVTYDKKGYSGDRMSYSNQMFYCPKIYCKDGFNVSLQIHNGNYCSSENGYREMGVDWQEVEFGFPSMNDKDMWKFSEMYGSCSWDEDGNEEPFNEKDFDVTGTVGSIGVKEMQVICDKHGGIDWGVTLSKDSAASFLKNR